jgi:hypothetical protein
MPAPVLFHGMASDPLHLLRGKSLPDFSILAFADAACYRGLEAVIYKKT